MEHILSEKSQKLMRKFDERAMQMLIEGKLDGAPQLLAERNAVLAAVIAWEDLPISDNWKFNGGTMTLLLEEEPNK